MFSELHPGLHFHQYQLLEQIGVGGQGVVWSAEDSRRNEIVAIKLTEVVDSEQQQIDDEMFERQVGKLLNVQHPHILPMYDFGVEGGSRYLVSPYVPGGSVFEKIRQASLPLEDALRFSAEVASALDYLHGQGIVHRDLKSSNILLSLKNHTYLADFGLARSVSLTTKAMHTGRGTAPYAPPEQLKRLEISAKSDIYSFGILLYEIFAGELPWGGESALGIQQLYSFAELPDPCELNNTLPPLMKDVLRRVTSGDPALRPSSAGEVMKMIYYIFELRDYRLPGGSADDRVVVRAHDAAELFDQNLAQWTTDETTSELSLTKFALIHFDHKRQDEKEVEGAAGRFMLFHALMYGYEDEYWWSRVANSHDRLAVCAGLLRMQNEVLAVRVLNHLLDDTKLQQTSGEHYGKIAAALLQVAVHSTDPALSRKMLSGLQALIPPTSAWKNAKPQPEQDKSLGALALEDSDAGDQAARLIGHIRSQPAVDFILKNADKDRLIPALLEIQRSAGSLPAFLPGNIRLRVTLEWIIHRLTIQPARLFGAYMLAFAGATLGIATQVYLTYRLPEFMDAARISSSLEQGLICGTLFGLGILLTRVIVERFSGSSAWLRVLFATLAGAIGMNISLFIFHVLFINTAPRGMLITLGCVLIALAFAVGGLIRWRAIRMILTSAAVLATIVGTWWIHVALAGSVTELTPFFRYDYAWPAAQIVLTACLVSLWIGIFGNLVQLAVKEP